MKTTHLYPVHRRIPGILVFLLLALCQSVTVLPAAPITGDTVTGDLTVEGDAIIIENTTDRVEIRNGPDRTDLWRDAPGEWVWSHGTTPTDVMTLGPDNILSLYDLGASSVNPAIVLNPGIPNASPAAIPPSILIGGDEVLTVANSPAFLAPYFVERSSNNNGSPGSLLMQGTFGGVGSIPTTGAGTRMMWYPEKGAFRAGRVTGNLWDTNNIGDYSTAMGYNVKSSGSYSTAFGLESVASGFASFAAGESAEASGSSAVAIGQYASTGGNHSVAIGTASAQGDGSAAIGEGAQASGDCSIALGPYAYTDYAAYGSLAFSSGYAIGYSSIAGAWGYADGMHSIALLSASSSASSSIAIGGCDWNWCNWPGNQTHGDSSTAVGGVGNQAHGFSSLASGFWTNAAAGYSVALGSLNLGQGTGGDTWIETDPLFELGNGIASRSWQEPAASTRSNAITTLKNGQTSLTNKAWKSATDAAPTDPEAPIAAYGPTASGGNALVVDGHTVLNGKVVISVPQGDISMGIYQ